MISQIIYRIVLYRLRTLLRVVQMMRSVDEGAEAHAAKFDSQNPNLHHRTSLYLLHPQRHVGRRLSAPDGPLRPGGYSEFPF